MQRTAAALTLMLLAATPAAADAATPPAAIPIELARVNGERITDADLKQAFVGKHGGHTVFLGGDGETRRFLNIVINERLLVQEAYNLGLDSDPAVKPSVDAFRDDTAVAHLLKEEIDGKASPSEEEIRQAWELADELFLAREIVLDTRDAADEARRSVMAGADFELLARSCSVAPSGTRGGNLTPSTWGSLPVEVEQALFALQPGEISPVFRAAGGWAVVQLVDRMDAQRPALDEKVSARIAAKLVERKKQALSDQLSSMLWKRYDARFAIDQLTPAELSRLAKIDPEAVVAAWRGGEIRAKEAFTPGELTMYSSFAPGRAADKVESTLRSAVNTALIRAEAQARKIDEVPAVADAIAKYEGKLMESVLYSKHVLKNVGVTDDEIRAAYEQQKEKLLLPEKRRVSHIAVTTEEEAKALSARIEKGEEFVELLRAHSLDKSTVKSEGDLGWIEKGRVAATYDPLFELAQGGVAQPIRSGSAWHVVRVTEIAPEHPLSFEEAKEKIRGNLLEKKKHDARAVWIEKLRKASEIEIVERGVKKFVEANPYEDPNQ